MFYIGIKKEGCEEGYSYYVEESDTVVSEKVTHEIKDANGVVIGTYDTTEQHIEHDNGYRYSDSEQFSRAVWNSFIVLPCRIVSLLFSIIALFVPNMYVSAIKPKTKYTYNYKAFVWLDILIFYDGKKDCGLESGKSID